MSLKLPRSVLVVTLALIGPGIGAAQNAAMPLPALIVSPAALRTLLPPAPSAQPCAMSWNNDDVTQVPEVQLDYGWSVQVSWELTARRIAGINFLNQVGTDRFVHSLRESRPDLAGLPFILGDASRLEKAEREKFAAAVSKVRESLQPSLSRDAFWKNRRVPEHPAKVAALTQILATETALKPGLIEHLAQSDGSEATQALARLAVFADEDWVRQATRSALQMRDTGPATGILVKGLRYPWPAVAQHAAEAIVKLGRADLAPELANMLDEPDPRAPAPRQVDSQRVYVVRELVRINHLRNCLLCHPPANGTGSLLLGSLIGGIPAPRKEAPQWADASAVFHGRVRADITYLRQDFSLLQNVARSDPGPARQRFDYLVRERTLTDQEARAYQTELAGGRGATPYRLIARQALRELYAPKGGTSAVWIALACTSLVVLQGPFFLWFRRRYAQPRRSTSTLKLNPVSP
jgi:hypothetical protein